jgi:hypothetical protein
VRNLAADFAWSGQAKTKMSTVYLHEMRAAMYAKPGLVPIRLIRSALGAARFSSL